MSISKTLISKILFLFISTFLFSKTSKACECWKTLTTDSLAQMTEYDFIAHVKITDDQYFKKPTEFDYETIGQLSFDIVELFKGEKINTILEYSKNSSCDIGVSKGEEWILFGKYKKGKMSIFACDRNSRYKENSGQRDWKFETGFYELKRLRFLYRHFTLEFNTEKRKDFYTNGKIEIEENYLNGKLNGERKIWYPNGKLFCNQFYINDTLDGKSEWFYESGQIYVEDYYQKGKKINVSRTYFDSSLDIIWRKMLVDNFYKTEDSLNFVFKRIQVQYETVFDAKGQAIISRQYTQVGKIENEVIIDPVKKLRTTIYYHQNGIISLISYTLNGKRYGHFQEYDENGLSGRFWDYDENGKAILTK